MLPDEAAAAGIDAATSVFPFAANGRALTLEAGEGGGFVRVVSRRADRRVLGIQAVGRHVAELAGEFAHALAMGAVLDDWRTRSTSTRPWARRSARPRCSASATRCISDRIMNAVRNAAARGRHDV